jgi:hypothetical protein
VRSGQREPNSALHTLLASALINACTNAVSIDRSRVRVGPLQLLETSRQLVRVGVSGHRGLLLTVDFQRCPDRSPR